MKKRPAHSVTKPKAKPAADTARRAPTAQVLRRRAEAAAKKRAVSKDNQSEDDPRRLFHELQVHQIELEMQNATLQDTQDMMELSLERYTDLYDFAPVAYFTLDSGGNILEVNFAGARLAGVERSELIGQNFAISLLPEMRPRFAAFLKDALSGEVKNTAEFDLLGASSPPRSVSIDVQRSSKNAHCRLVATDITERKQSEQTRTRLEVLASTNSKLELEIIHREDVERSLLKSQRHQSKMLAESKRMQTELRRLTHLIFETLEEERRRISRELHDQISQTLVSINFQLTTLASDKKIKPHMLSPAIRKTQKLVGESVEIIHNFARYLRPPALDHLGLIPALEALVAEFLVRTQITVHFNAIPQVEKLNSGQRIVIYRVVQSALSNVAKHSEAKNVIIEMQKESRCILFTIADDGKSFDARLLRHGKADRRLGLLGMRERAEMVGGSFEVQTKPGKGTTVKARIPISGSLPGRKAPLPKSIA
jgi:PAS domain S-box-containing protein